VELSQRRSGHIGRRDFVRIVMPVAFIVGCGATPAFADSGASDSVKADPNAVLVFDRAGVSSIPAGNHSGAVVVASSDLPRPAQGQLYAPLETLVPTSPFGYRINPLTGQPGEFHWGQDFAAADGTRIYSADAGVVRAAGWHPWGGGNRVEVDHGNGLVTTYNHMKAAAVKTGDSVESGQVVGVVGQTGSATGPHLHFETILNGHYEDPMQWKFLPLQQKNPVGDLTLTDYTPKDGQPAPGQPAQWSIPTQLSEPAPNEQIQKAPAPTPPPPPAAAAPTKSTTPSSPSPSPSSTGSSPTPSPAPDPTSAPPQTSTPTPTATPTPSPTPTPTATASSAPTATTAASSSTPTATPTPTPTQ
jgi:cell division septation protein DedD